MFRANPGFEDSLPFGPVYGTSTAPPFAVNAGFVGPGSYICPQPMFIPPTATFNGLQHNEQPMGPTLTIPNIPTKTRVETQIPIKMALSPMPPGITKLHLPLRTMAKSKWIAKPPPSRSPDMLELDVMPVCASAMKKPHLQKRAFALARGEGLSPQPRNQIQASSPEDRDAVCEPVENIDPMDGGPISICDNCVNRERKRANRKIEKDPSDEEIKWKQSEKERIVVFNGPEVVEWEPFTSSNFNEAAGKRAKRGPRGKKKSEVDDEVPSPVSASGLEVPYPERAKQVCLMMRITCYCRHQGEADGFRLVHCMDQGH